MTPARVALDVTPAVRQRAGIGRYNRELVRALARRRAYDYVGFVGDRGGGDPGLGLPLRTAGVPARLLTIAWHRLGLALPLEMFTGPLDALHAPDFLAPPTRSARVLLTVHDLTFLRRPEHAEPALARFLARRLPRAAARAAHILVDSEATGRDLAELVGVAQEQISVCYPGIGPEFAPRAQAAAWAELGNLGIRPPYVLGVGTLEPRKNWPGLVDAFLATGLDNHSLVLAGGRGWGDGPIRAAIAAAGDRVIHLGFVGDDLLPALYAGADAFAYPSFYEGFGLPPLEAMASGVPTVVSDAPCLPEVVGDGALIVPVGDTPALGAALRQVVLDTALRHRLSGAGRAQAGRFTWDRAAAVVEAGLARVTNPSTG